MKYLKLIKHDIELIWLLAKRDLSDRYNNTFLGFFWTLAHPLIFGLTYYYVFKYIFKIDVPNYLLFLLAGMFPWIWFQTAVAQTCNSVVGNAGIVKKVKFNRWILPASTVVQTGVNFLLSMVVFLIFMFSKGVFPSFNWFFYFPLIMIVQFMLILGLAYIISAVNVYFRDLNYIVGLLLNILFYFTPVGYAMKHVPEAIRGLIGFNPVAGLILSWRELLIDRGSPIDHLIQPLIFSICLLAVGIILFNKLQKEFTELL